LFARCYGRHTADRHRFSKVLSKKNIEKKNMDTPLIGTDSQKYSQRITMKKFREREREREIDD
jgi:hypothetical protein